MSRAPRQVICWTFAFLCLDLLPARALMGAASAHIYDLNSRFQLVGHAENRAGQPQAHLWNDGEARSLTPAGDIAYSTARAINEKGQVVGWKFRSEADDVWLEAVLWQEGRETPLEPLGMDTQTAAYDINNKGEIVGLSDAFAVLWTANGQPRPLGTLGGESSYALSINNRSWIVGGAQNRDGDERAFLWREGQMIDLGTLGGASSVASQVNDYGQVFGRSELKDGSWKSFVWEKGAMREAGDVEPSELATALAQMSTVTPTLLSLRDQLWQSASEVDPLQPQSLDRWMNVESSLVRESSPIAGR